MFRGGSRGFQGGSRGGPGAEVLGENEKTNIYVILNAEALSIY